MKQFEYKELPTKKLGFVLPDGSDKELSRLGKEGWELVTSCREGALLLFKREIENDTMEQSQGQQYEHVYDDSY
jgi:hypothetical protein